MMPLHRLSITTMPSATCDWSLPALIAWRWALSVSMMYLLLCAGALAGAEPISFDTVVADESGGRLQESLIWAPGSPPGHGMTAAFRKTHRLETAPRQAKLRIFADCRYVLWINGSYVGRGPNRFQIRGPEYDTYDVTNTLKAGVNLFAVLAFATPEGGFWRAQRHDPGFTALLDVDGTVAWTTRDGWQCSTQTRYEKIIGSGDHLEDGVVDLRKECGPWWQADYAPAPAAWQPPTPIAGTTWGPFTASRIPLLRERRVAVQLPPGIHLPVVLQQGGKLPLQTDGVTLGYVRLVVEASDGAELRLPGRGRSRFLLKAGTQELMTLDTRGLPSRTAIEVVQGTVTITALDLIERLYPFEQVGAFTCSDPVLTQVWNLCVNTHRLLSEDAYISGALKERTEWTDNSPPSYDVTRIAFAGVNDDGTLVHADPRLLAASLRRTGLSLQKNDCVRACTSQDNTDLHTTMEDRSCEWIRGFRLHYDTTGSTDLMRELWPAIVKQLNYFLDRRTERGLVRCRDWVVWGNPLAYAQGETTTMNAFIYRALMDGAWIGRLIGRHEDEVRYEEAAMALAKAINTVLWDASTRSYFAGYFTDADLTSKNRGMAKYRFEERLQVVHHLCPPTWHANLFMLDRGPVPDERVQDVQTAAVRLAEAPSWSIMEYYYYGNLLYRMDRQDYDVAVLTFLRQGWSPMVAKNDLQTVWEMFKGGYPDHPYGMFPAWLMSTYVLGVRWEDGIPRNRKLVIEPHPGDLTEAKGVVETEVGPVPISWNIQGEHVTLTGTVPMAAALRLRSPTATINGATTSGRADGPRYVYPITAGAFTAILKTHPE